MTDFVVQAGTHIYFSIYKDFLQLILQYIYTLK